VSSGSGHRLLEVPPERLARWVEGFGERHGPVAVTADDTAVRLEGADGAVAELEVPWPPLLPPLAVTEQSVSSASGRSLPDDRHATVTRVVTLLAAHAAAPRTAALVLVRRGGYGAGIARDGKLLAHAVGTRYVQGRTAAGGWSQQRFARRRSGQAAALAGSAGDAVHKVVSGATSAPEVLVVAGDRGLVDEVLAEPRLVRLAALPRSPLLPVRDPRLVVLTEMAQRCRAVRVRLDEPRLA